MKCVAQVVTILAGLTATAFCTPEPAEGFGLDEQIGSPVFTKRVAEAEVGHVINFTIGLNVASFNQGGSPGLSTVPYSLEAADGAPPQSSGSTSLINNATEKVRICNNMLIICLGSVPVERGPLGSDSANQKCERINVRSNIAGLH